MTISSALEEVENDFKKFLNDHHPRDHFEQRQPCRQCKHVNVDQDEYPCNNCTHNPAMKGVGSK